MTNQEELIIKSIERHVCQQMDVSVDLIKSKTRKREISDARHVLLALLSSFTLIPLQKISRDYNRDHSSIWYATKAVIDLRDTNHKYTELLTKIIWGINLDCLTSFTVLDICDRSKRNLNEEVISKEERLYKKMWNLLFGWNAINAAHKEHTQDREVSLEELMFVNFRILFTEMEPCETLEVVGRMRRIKEILH